MLHAASDFLLLWLIHVLGWFVLSALSAVVRGDWDALKPRSAIAIGLTSAALQKLIMHYFF